MQMYANILNKHIFSVERKKIGKSKNEIKNILNRVAKS
jgi:hypothetical protein